MPVEPLKRNHEVAGFTFGVIGPLLRAAARLRDRRRAGALRSRRRKGPGEATVLASLNRLSKGFPQPLQHDLQQAIRALAQFAIEVERLAVAAGVIGG